MPKPTAPPPSRLRMPTLLEGAVFGLAALVVVGLVEVRQLTQAVKQQSAPLVASPPPIQIQFQATPYPGAEKMEPPELKNMPPGVPMPTQASAHPLTPLPFDPIPKHAELDAPDVALAQELKVNPAYLKAVSGDKPLTPGEREGFRQLEAHVDELANSLHLDAPQSAALHDILTREAASDAALRRKLGSAGGPVAADNVERTLGTIRDKFGPAAAAAARKEMPKLQLH